MAIVLKSTKSRLVVACSFHEPRPNPPNDGNDISDNDELMEKLSERAEELTKHSMSS